MPHLRNNTRSGKPVRRFGFLVDALDRNFQNQILEGITFACRSADIELIIYSGALQFEPNDRNSQYEVVRNFIFPHDIDGLMVLSGAITEHYCPRKTVAMIRDMNRIPTVSIALDIPGISSVLVDNEKGIRDMFRHLTDVHGCRHIAFLKGPEGHEEADLRYRTYCQALQEGGLPFCGDMVVEGSYFSEDAGYAGIEQLFHQYHGPLDAVMAVDDSVALGAVKKLRSLGISIGDQVRVTGFDDLEMAAFSSPGLTTVYQPFFKQGIAAVEALTALLDTSEVQHVMLPTELVHRGSCGCTASAESLILDTGQENHQFSTLPQLEEIIRIVNQGSLQECQGSLLETIRAMIIQDYENFSSLAHWPFIFKAFYPYLIKLDGDSLVKESLYKQCTEIFYHYLLLEKQRGKLNSDEQRYNLHILNHNLLSTFSHEHLLELLKEKLPGLNIGTCYLVLYDQYFNRGSGCGFVPGQESSVVLAFYNNEDLLKNKTSVPVSAGQLLPGEFINRGRDDCLIFLPLSFKDDHYGYILFSYGRDVILNLYETLRIIIGNALHSCLLMGQLEKSVEQKTNFFINIAHEMKTPLTLISSYLEQYLESPTDMRDLQIVQQNVQKLKRDMVNFLDTEKLERGQIFYNNCQMVNLSEFIRQKVNSFRKLADDAYVTMACRLADRVHVWADPSAMDRILNNLLENGIRYNRRNGVLTLEMKLKLNQIHLTVSNSGEGIPKARQKHIFDPYYQVSHKKRNTQGIGMGLSIVKKIVDDLDGTISLRSRPDLTSFVLKIPAADPPDPGMVRTDFTPEFSPFEIQIPMANTIRIDQYPYDQRKDTILLVDDNKELVALMKHNMDEQYNVYYAFSASEALTALSEIPVPDLIISDIMMDHLDGYEFYNKLNEQERFRNIPFLFLTAETHQTAKKRALKMGAVDYICKPFDVFEVLQKVKNLIDLQKRQREAVSEEMKSNLFRFLESQKSTGSVGEVRSDSDQSPRTQSPDYPLSSREQEIVSRLEKGLLYKEIADEMHVSLNTVKTHIQRIYKKCEVNNKVELLRLFSSN